MDYKAIQTVRQLANQLRVDVNFLNDYFSGSIQVHDSRSINSKIIKISPSSSNTIIANISKFYIPKKNKKLGHRIVYSIRSDELSNTLKILNLFLSEIYKPKVCVQGFVDKRNIRTNATLHLAKLFLMSVDIKDCFETISSEMIENSLIKLGFTQAISYYISNLVTIDGYLVQGFNTSPMIANIVLDGLDIGMLNLCKSDMTYTRYADDLYFSSDTSFPEFEEIDNIVKKHGFSLNPMKTQFMKRGVKQYVTGLSVFDSIGPRIPKRIKRNLRLEIYYVNKYGYKSHVLRKLKYSFTDYKDHRVIRDEVNAEIINTRSRINGWLHFINSIEPDFVKKMNAIKCRLP